MRPNQPNNWDVQETGGIINARNRITQEVFSGTRAEFNAKLQATDVPLVVTKIIGSTLPASEFDGEPDGTLHVQVIL